MYRFILIFFALLMFILSVDGTITLRYLLIVSLIVGLLINIIKNREGRENLKILTKSKELRLILISLLIFAFFILFHTIFLSYEPLWSLSEFKGHIIYPCIYLFVGMLLANYATQSKQMSKELIITVIFFSMFIHILYIDLVAIDNLFRKGVMLRRYGGLMDSPVLPNYLTNILLAMIIAEILYRLRVNQKVLMVSNGILYLLLLACIFSTFVESLRLGDISLVLLGIGSATVFLYNNKQYSNNIKWLISAVLIFILSVPLIYNINTDPRWSSLLETIPVAIYSADEKVWIDPKATRVVTKSGREISQSSNYQRIAFAVRSLAYIVDEPMGVGYGRNAFGHALELRYPEAWEKRGAHAHSAILDLTIGAGIIGTFLWLFCVFVIIRSAVKELQSSYNYFAIIVLFLTMGFISRGLVDANMRDHVFLQFMLILGISIFFMIGDKNKAIE